MNLGEWYVSQNEKFRAWKKRQDEEMTIQNSIIYGLSALVMVLLPLLVATGFCG